MSPMMTPAPSDLEKAIRTRSSSEPGREKIAKATRRIFLAVLVFVIINIPPILYMWKKEPPTEEHDKAPGTFSVLPRKSYPDFYHAAQEGEALTKSDEIRANTLRSWEWIELTEPSQWFYPTKEGFSQFNRVVPLPWPVLEGYVPRPVLLPEQAFPESRLVASLPRMEEQNFLDLAADIAEPAQDTREIQAVAPRWRRVGGHSLQNPPQLTAQEQTFLKNPAILAKLSDACQPTRLEIQFRPGFSLPRIVLRESCGATELDQAAMRALRENLRQLGANELAFPRVSSVLLEVDWRI